jgi:hypothetical protein
VAEDRWKYLGMEAVNPLTDGTDRLSQLQLCHFDTALLQSPSQLHVHHLQHSKQHVHVACNNDQPNLANPSHPAAQAVRASRGPGQP